MEGAKPDFNPEIKLGILGGGQLGLMLSQASISMGLGVYILDPDPLASARPFCQHFQVGSFADEETVLHFGRNLDVLTIEIEHVHVGALFQLEALGVQVYPQPRIIKLIQDKSLQKQFLMDNGFPTAPFHYLASKSDLLTFSMFFPGMLKSCRGGYDGKGVSAIRNRGDAESILEGSFPEGPCILEKWASLELEISVLVARNAQGEVKVYDPVQMEFNSQANLVEFLRAPALISSEIAVKAQKIAIQIIEKLEMVGLLAVEMFLMPSGEIWVNEMAPRPHNSGHHTMEACWTSQFEQVLRAILGLPLGNAGTRTPSVMVNILGEPGYTGKVAYRGLREVMAMEGVYIHLYGKMETRPMRKMGHISILDSNPDKAYLQAKEIQKIFKTSQLAKPNI